MPIKKCSPAKVKCPACTGSSTNPSCPITLPGTCVNYTGSPITGPGINVNDNFNTVTNKLANYSLNNQKVIDANSGVFLNDTTKTIKLGLNTADPLLQEGSIELGRLCYITQGEDIAAGKQIGVLFQGTGKKLDIIGLRGMGLPAAGYSIEVEDTGALVSMVANDNNTGVPTTGGMQMVFSTVGDMEVTDGINSKGLQYSGDYESNFVPRSLVTKQYVDAIVGGGANANNGLSLNSGFVQLGQLVNTIGNPALVTNNREIPMNNGLTVSFKNISNSFTTSINPGNISVTKDTTVSNPSLEFYDSNIGTVFSQYLTSTGFVFDYDTLPVITLDAFNNIQFHGYPNTRNNGTATKALYTGSSGELLLGNFPVESANNGLSVSSNIAVLGQTIGAVGNPAILTSNREIPTGGFNTVFTGNGRIGIGTSSPSTTLHVETTSNTSGVLITSTSSTPSFLLKVRSYYQGIVNQAINNAGLSGLTLRDAADDPNTDFNLMFQPSGKSLYYQLAPGVSATGYSMLWCKNDQNLYGRLLIDTGRWQFGTLGPVGFTFADNGYTLQVVGNLFVNTFMRLNPQASAPASPTKGMLYVNNSTNQFLGYDGTTWVDLGATGGGGSVTNVSGTTNRITVTSPTTTPVIDIASTYVGQNSITTLGTISTGVWQGTAIATTYGGIPTAGTTGQVLTKNSNTNYDVSWTTVTGTGTVTNFIFTNGNGFSGSVSSSTTTPTLSLTTSLTTGSVPFIAAGGALSQDNNNLFWDSTNNRLGIGTNTPISRETVRTDGLGAYTTTTTQNSSGLSLVNNTAAISGTQQASPALLLRGFGWGTTAATSQSVDWRLVNLPTQGTVPASSLRLQFSLNGATYSEPFLFNSTGQFNATGNIVAGASSTFAFTTRTNLSAPVDGNLLLRNNANTNFGLIQLGGSTSAFPAIKRNTTGIDIRLADDSAYTSITSSNITLDSQSGAATRLSTISTTGQVQALANGTDTQIMAIVGGTPTWSTLRLTNSATLNFPSTPGGDDADLTITVTGAADGDPVALGIPNAAVLPESMYMAWVSAANTVTVRFINFSLSAQDPPSAVFKVSVSKF